MWDRYDLRDDDRDRGDRMGSQPLWPWQHE